MASKRGFSLVELVMAVGLAAVTVISVVALYRPILRTAGTLEDETRTQILVTRIEALWRERGLAAGLEAVAAGETYFADREGEVIALPDDPAWASLGASEAERAAARFYEFTLHRQPTLSPLAEAFPGCLVVIVRLRWPAHRLDGGRVTDPAGQETRWAIFGVGR